MLTYSRINRRKKRNRLGKKKRPVSNRLSNLKPLELKPSDFDNLPEMYISRGRSGDKVMVRKDKLKDYDGILDYIDKYVDPYRKVIQYKPLP